MDGFWRSFRAALICYPLFLLLLDQRLTPAQAAASSGWRIVIAETIGFVIAWTAFPLLVQPLTRWFGREDRFLRFMVAYNWCQVPQTLLFVAVALLAGGGPPPSTAAQLTELAAACAALAYEWYVARLTLEVSSAQAALVILLDVLLGSLLNRVTESLY